MKQQLKHLWLFLLRGLIFIALSFYVFMHPVDALVGLALFIGISLLITGIFMVILALGSRNANENWGWRLAEGIIDVLFAFILLTSPGITATILPFIVGFWTMVYGVMMFADAFQYKKSGDQNWWIGLVGGLFTIVIGYIITNNLLVGAIAVTYWIGFGFILAGIINISIFVRLRKLKSVMD